MERKCPECSAPMTYVGRWPDGVYRDSTLAQIVSAPITHRWVCFECKSSIREPA
jgi:hypothetical protein